MNGPTSGTPSAADRARPAFHTVKEVSEVLRVSVTTVYRLIHSGELTAVRVGGSYRVPARALAPFFEGFTAIAEGSATEQSRFEPNGAC